VLVEEGMKGVEYLWEILWKYQHGGSTIRL